ncbi:MAG TPA: hypothetical protein ENK49_04575 [Gammaproteobacteria bacterium]|nr:hypothetical protein [Gammaproteobacteria bacterium]
MGAQSTLAGRNFSFEITASEPASSVPVIQDHLYVSGTRHRGRDAELEAEADVLCGAQRHKHIPDRVDTRAGSYEQSLQTRAGKLL